MDEVRVALVSMGSYAYNFYGRRLLQPPKDRGMRFVGGVSRSPENVRKEYVEAGISVYRSLEEFYENDWADLVISSGPIHLHEPVACEVLSRGSSVLSEKPVSATIQEALRMAEAEERSGKFVAVGYQWSFSDAVQTLKRDVMEGLLGDPVTLRTLILWPRTLSYYGRNDWAGRVKIGGRWVLDSPVQNATAHYLHNMFYILGDSREESARPVDVESELYRANDIENYDAAALRCVTEEGTEVLFYSAHCVPENRGIDVRYEFEGAVVEYNARGDSCFTARFRDGRTKCYGNPEDTSENKLWDSVRAVRTGEPVACGIGASIPHVLAVNGAQESAEIRAFPKDMVRHSQVDGGTLVWADGLAEALQESYQRGVLPSEAGRYPWAVKGSKVDLRGYSHFPSTCS
jgi:predicted dehydrogenase